jgi:hypothetical protein
MRGKIRKEVVRYFSLELGRRLSEFKRGEGDDPTWELEPCPHLKFFIVLVPLRYYDEFVIEIGWSTDGRYPGRGKGSPDPKLPSWYRRLTQLWHKGVPELVWDVTPKLSDEELLARTKARNRGENIKVHPEPPFEEVMPRVEPLVMDALNKLEQYAIPLFRQVAENRGCPWPE